MNKPFPYAIYPGEFRKANPNSGYDIERQEQSVSPTNKNSKMSTENQYAGRRNSSVRGITAQTSPADAPATSSMPRQTSPAAAPASPSGSFPQNLSPEERMRRYNGLNADIGPRAVSADGYDFGPIFRPGSPEVQQFGEHYDRTGERLDPTEEQYRTGALRSHTGYGRQHDGAPTIGRLNEIAKEYKARSFFPEPKNTTSSEPTTYTTPSRTTNKPDDVW